MAIQENHVMVAYSSLYNAYDNVGVYRVEFEAFATTIQAEDQWVYQTTVTIDDPGHFAISRIQTNGYSGSGPYTTTPLTWQMWPAASVIFMDLSTDPYSQGIIDGWLTIELLPGQVTFYFTVGNPFDLPIAVEALTFGIEYCIQRVRTN